MVWEIEGNAGVCLASGGGQQGPLLAAAGAVVTVFDNSPRQLGQDRIVAEREGLAITMVQGDMADLSAFADASFDLIVHPVSNCFAAEIRVVWRECFRVLRRGGILLSGFNNPVRYIFEDEKAQNGSLQVRYSIPYSDLANLSMADREQLIVRDKRAVEFGHTLADQIGGQMDAGFLLSGFYEDGYGAAENDAISRYMETFIATRAVKP